MNTLDLKEAHPEDISSQLQVKMPGAITQGISYLTVVAKPRSKLIRSGQCFSKAIRMPDPVVGVCGIKHYDSPICAVDWM